MARGDARASRIGISDSFGVRSLDGFYAVPTFPMKRLLLYRQALLLREAGGPAALMLCHAWMAAGQAHRPAGRLGGTVWDWCAENLTARPILFLWDFPIPDKATASGREGVAPPCRLPRRVLCFLIVEDAARSQRAFPAAFDSFTNE